MNYGVPTDECSKLYVGDIEIIFKNVVSRQIYSKHENEDLVVVEEASKTNFLITTWASWSWSKQEGRRWGGSLARASFSWRVLKYELKEDTRGP